MSKYLSLDVLRRSSLHTTGLRPQAPYLLAASAKTASSSEMQSTFQNHEAALKGMTMLAEDH